MDRFERVYSVNVAQSWPDLRETFSRLRSLLAPGGRVATTFMPHSRNPTRGDARRVSERISAALDVAGYARIEEEWLELTPVPAVCVRAAID
jgi:hypothetical protein